MARPRQYVEAPPVTPLPYGLLSAALVLDDLTGHAQMGVQYEPEACATAHLTRAACEADPDYGTLSVSVDAAGLATITADGFPTRGTSYTVSWGDGTDPETAASPDGLTHTYAAPGTYPVRVTDDRYGYTADASVDVVAATASGPFDATVGFAKVGTEGIDLVTADPFTLYTLFRCAPVGVDLEDRARRALRVGEQRAVEQAVGDRLPLADGAVDLTPVPGSPTHPTEGLSILEGFAGQHYGGVPVIHVPRKVGTFLGGIDRYGSRLETRQGALVASGGGYHSLAGPPTNAADPDTIQAPGDGEAWLYVTGQVVVRRSPTVEATPLTMARSPQATNEATVLAERPYAASWECITGAVLVSTRFVNGMLGGTSYPEPA
jgi:hypothetical protein